MLTSSLISSCDIFNSGDKSRSSGEVVWSVKNQEILTVSTQPAIDGDRVFFIQDAQLKAYSLEEGSSIWATQICSPGRTCDYSRQIAQTEDRLFIDQGFDIQAHSKSTGSIAWETRITDDGQEVSGLGSPLLSQDETFLYAGRKGYVVKLRKDNGQIARRFELDRLVPQAVIQGATEPIISPFGDDRLYIPTSYFDDTETPSVSKGNIFSYDAITGEYKWGYEIKNRYSTFTLPNGEMDSTIVRSSVFDASVTSNFVVVLAGASVLALDRFTGEKIWETTFIGDQEDGFDVGMTVEEDGIYIASAGFHATKLDLETGQILWRHDITFSNTSIPTVQNGRMYFNNSGGGGIWVLDTKDGSVIFNKRPPNYRNDSFDVYISSLGVGEGYMVNVGSKAVYCLRVP